MGTYIKTGIVARIDIIKNKNESKKYIKKHFNEKLFTVEDDIYLLKPKLLTENLKEYRLELLSFSENRNDSLGNCEAYCLETDVEKLMEKKVFLTDENTQIYFENFESNRFDLDMCFYSFGGAVLRIYMIPVLWDINKTDSEDFCLVTNTVNNLIRKAMTNVLKDASWFSII